MGPTWSQHLKKLIKECGAHGNNMYTLVFHTMIISTMNHAHCFLVLAVSLLYKKYKTSFWERQLLFHKNSQNICLLNCFSTPMDCFFVSSFNPSQVKSYSEETSNSFVFSRRDLEGFSNLLHFSDFCFIHTYSSVFFLLFWLLSKLL